ncbi:MAG: hypothetical protein AAFV53_32445 [Myxococcota bacterium]
MSADQGNSQHEAIVMEVSKPAMDELQKLGVLGKLQEIEEHADVDSDTIDVHIPACLADDHHEIVVTFTFKRKDKPNRALIEENMEMQKRLYKAQADIAKLNRHRDELIGRNEKKAIAIAAMEQQLAEMQGFDQGLEPKQPSEEAASY